MIKNKQIVYIIYSSHKKYCENGLSKDTIYLSFAKKIHYILIKNIFLIKK